MMTLCPIWRRPAHQADTSTTHFLCVDSAHFEKDAHLDNDNEVPVVNRNEAFAVYYAACVVHIRS